MSGRLEERYRALLRLLPAEYRAAWEEEMVATFLAGMASDDPDENDYVADFGRPSWAEAVSVFGLAARLRVGGVGAAPRRRVLGDAVRLIALIGLLSQAVMALVGLANLLWLTGKVPGLAPPPWAVGPTMRWPAIQVLLALIAVPAYIALLRGHRRIAWSFAAVTVVTFAVSPVMEVVGGVPFGVSNGVALLLDVLLLLSLAAFHADAPPISARPWLVALPIGFVVTTVVVAFAQSPQWVRWPLLDWAGLCCVAVIAAAAAHLARHLTPGDALGRTPGDALGRTPGHALDQAPGRGPGGEPAPMAGRAPGAAFAPMAGRAPGRAGDPAGAGFGVAAWSLALGLLAGAVLAQRAVTLGELAGWAPGAHRDVVLALGFGEAALTLAVAVPLVLLTAHVLRRMPPAAPAGMGAAAAPAGMGAAAAPAGMGAAAAAPGVVGAGGGAGAGDAGDRSSGGAASSTGVREG